MVREVKGEEMMCVLVAGRGARERGGRRLEVKVHSKRRSPCHNVAYLVRGFCSYVEASLLDMLVLP